MEIIHVLWKKLLVYEYERLSRAVDVTKLGMYVGELALWFCGTCKINGRCDVWFYLEKLEMVFLKNDEKFSILMHWKVCIGKQIEKY